jgi:trehalose utilization protein
LSLIALHSAHWSTPFIEAMNERAVEDALAKLKPEERKAVRVVRVPPPLGYTAPRRGDALTPSSRLRTDKDGKPVLEVRLPICCFPAWRADGKPSTIRTLLPKHPIAKGLAAGFTLPNTEMYDEPFHVPPPDEVVFEERFAGGERFRSGCVWRLGKGRVFYFRPGHETFGVYRRPEPLRVLENAVRWLAAQQRAAPAADNKLPLDRHEEVIYGHKLGMAMTLDFLRPPKPNGTGTGVIFVMSGGWVSRRDPLARPEQRAALFTRLLERGYRLFLVYHGAQPKFAILEILEDIHRSVRFVRHNAKRFGIDPGRIGICGGSAGGHLSLMLGTTGKKGDPRARDPVDRESSAVQCSCFCPPTDFLNYGNPGEDAVGVGVLEGFRPAFGLKTGTPEERRELGKKISPIEFVSATTAPTLIARRMLRKEKAGHAWAGMFDGDLVTFAGWFDQHLKAKEK